MKKFLSLTLCLLAYAFCAVAQTSHWSYQYGQYKSEAYIYAYIQVYQETLNGFEQVEFTANDYQTYEFAAFIDEELHGVAQVMTVTNPTTQEQSLVLRFHLEGNDDDGEISFKAYDPAKQKEYELVLASEPIFFSDSETYGTPSDPLELQINLPMETTPVTSITTPFIGFDTASGAFVYIECNVGDDLTPYFVDGQAFSVLPAEASNKAVTFELYETETSPSLTIDKAGNIIAATTGLGVVKVTSVDNPQATCLVYVLAYNDYSTITATQDVLNVTYKDEPVDITQLVLPLFALGPDGCQTISGEYSIVSSAPDIVKINDNGAFANAPGEAILTATMSVVNRLMKTFDPNGNHTTTVSASVRVVVTQGVTGLQVQWPNNMATGREAMFTVTPLPAGAQLNPDGLFTLNLAYSNMDLNSTETVTLTKNAEDGTYIGTLTPEIPGLITMILNYDGMDGTQVGAFSEETEVGYTFTMSHGWQWSTIPYVDFAQVKDMTSVFGNELVELRTQSSQVYNDPVYGYFGDVDQLSQGQCFKLKMELYDAPKSYVFYGGNLYGLGNEPTMRKGWSYMPNPYVQPQYISEVFDASITFTDGDRIVSKDNGFVEYNAGKWVGDLSILQPGEGYLFYNAGNAAIDLSFSQEFSPSSSRRMAPRQPRQKVWNYDASLFRDNMTIVAQIDNQYVGGDQYVVGAFVGDECRGEGVAVDGRLFITVHANSGELISFKLYDQTSGQIFNIDQTVRMQQMLGSLKQPFSMTTNADATGIQTVYRKATASDCYDLRGLRTGTNSKGVLLQRADDGSIRKMMR